MLAGYAFPLQERVVTRARDCTGQLTTHEQHRGLDPQAAHSFDQEWVQQAQQTMPHWMSNGSATSHQLQGSNRQQQQRLALPASGAQHAGGMQRQYQYGGQQQQQHGWPGAVPGQQQHGGGTQWSQGY